MTGNSRTQSWPRLTVALRPDCMAVLLGLYILAVTAGPHGILGPPPDAGLGPAIKMVGVERFELRPSGPKPDALPELRYTPTMLSYPHSGYSSLLRIQNQFYFVFPDDRGALLAASGNSNCASGCTSNLAAAPPFNSKT